MIIYKNILFGALFLATAILLEFFWLSTGAVSLGVFTLIIALIASGTLARSIRIGYQTNSKRLRKFFTVTGLEN